MKLIYIAGRYRDNRGEFYVRMNIREAEREALFVWKSGGAAICPHKNTAGLGGAFGIPDDTWIKGDLEILRRCDALYAISNYVASAGAQAEIEYAKAHGIPILYNQAEVLKFLGVV